MNLLHIEVDTAGFHAALEALMMDDPHPGDDYQDCPSHWLRRALYAYEWAKQAYLPRDSGMEPCQEVPQPGKAREAVLLHESLAQERWTRR
ncbi:hypothetical protein IU479_30865 [Nocardia abscessus]|uniref:hypothetical protein n=1 Tax=Nocardia TaxID=1817 RepID=UPI001895674A|nr:MULTISPECIES: hypothetical protein [Nocardia]MBF6222500.1 hypothetical protein [Nocardia abscessus]